MVSSYDDFVVFVKICGIGVIGLECFGGLSPDIGTGNLRFIVGPDYD